MAAVASKAGQMAAVWWRPTTTSAAAANNPRINTIHQVFHRRVCRVSTAVVGEHQLGGVLASSRGRRIVDGESFEATTMSRRCRRWTLQSAATEAGVGSLREGVASMTACATVIHVHRGSAAMATAASPHAADGEDDGSHHPPFLIGVCGGTASGKTSVCRKIMELLKRDTELEHQGVVNISQDCFYKDLTPEQAANISHYNFDHPDAFDFDEIHSSLKTLKEGSPVDIPRYDFVTSARLKQSTHVPFADVILFDGIMAFHQREVRELFDLKIFVDTDADTRLARRVRRDIVERGRGILQVLDQYEETVKPSFDSFILPTKKHADIIVPRGAENTAAIDLIHHHIRMKLLTRRRSGITSM